MTIGPINEKEVVNKIVEQSKELPLKTSNEQTKGKDKVEISTEGRKKLSLQADNYRKDEIKAGKQSNQLSAKVLRAKNKMEAGHYDLNEVKEKIIDKLTDNIYNDLEKLK